MSNSDIIKEYLVSLGFKVDQNTLNKYDSALVKTTKVAFTFAAAMVGVAAAATRFVDTVSKEMDGLYWSSVRIKDSINNVQDFKLHLSKLGGTAEGAASALESVARYMRTNPAAEGFMRNLGIETRDANGQLKSSIDIVKQIASLPMPYWLKVKFADRFGVDEETLMAIARLAPDAENKLTKLYQMAGLNADEAGRKSMEFQSQVKDTTAAWGVAATVLAVRLMPAASAFLGWAEAVVGLLIQVDAATGGIATQMLALAASIYAVNLALRLTFGTTLLKMLGGLLMRIALLTVTAFPALANAIWAVGVAITALPIGWVLLIGTALAGAALLVINNWDKVKAYFGSFVNWLRDKYNMVAKFLGLPQWDKPAQRPDAINDNDIAGDAGVDETGSIMDELRSRRRGPRDFQQEERDLGPNSHFGATKDMSSNQQLTGHALSFFKKVGWTAEQSAGIVANLVHESGLRTNAKGDGGKAYGIAQWHPDRQANFKEWAGKDIRESNLDEQLGFVNYELTKGAEKFAGKMLKASTDAARAGAVVSKYYERPKATGAEMAKRGRTASQLVDGTRLAPSSGGAKTVNVTQKTDIKITGSDAGATGRAVVREQGRLNGDLVRNFAGAVDGA